VCFVVTCVPFCFIVMYDVSLFSMLSYCLVGLYYLSCVCFCSVWLLFLSLVIVLYVCFIVFLLLLI
jgi:hypothetical protein